MAEGHLLQFHEDMEACVTRIVNTMRVTWPNGCKLGDVDVSSVIIRYLWHKYLSKCPDMPDAEIFYKCQLSKLSKLSNSF